MLCYLEAQEVDTLREFGRLPVGTDIYRFKGEQYKESSTTRCEIEKLIHEQMLRSLKRNYDVTCREENKQFEMEKWIDEQRRYIVAGKIRRDLSSLPQVVWNKEIEADPGPIKEEKKVYDP